MRWSGILGYNLDRDCVIVGSLAGEEGGFQTSRPPPEVQTRLAVFANPGHSTSSRPILSGFYGASQNLQELDLSQPPADVATAALAWAYCCNYGSLDLLSISLERR